MKLASLTDKGWGAAEGAPYLTALADLDDVPLTIGVWFCAADLLAPAASLDVEGNAYRLHNSSSRTAILNEAERGRAPANDRERNTVRPPSASPHSFRSIIIVEGERQPLLSPPKLRRKLSGLSAESSVSSRCGDQGLGLVPDVPPLPSFSTKLRPGDTDDVTTLS